MGLAGGIDNAAHLGGLISGFIIGIVLSPQLKSDREYEPVEEMKRMLIEALNGSVEVILGYHKKINDFDFDSFEKHWSIFFEELN